MARLPANPSIRSHMKIRPTLAIAVALATTVQAQTTHELTNVGSTFSPALITMQAGDSIHLVLSAPHTCTEVDEATWNSNGNTSNGGFNFTGEVTFAIDDPGTYYYVCVPHAAMGMKGRIIVEGGTGMAGLAATPAMRLYPNPANGAVHVEGLPAGSRVRLLADNGAVVLDSPVELGAVLDVSGVKPGSYRLQVIGDKEARPAVMTLVIVR